jgi:DNA polymerase V
MENEILHRSAYNGTKSFTQQQVQSANATGFGAAADDYMDRGLDLNELLVMNKPATYFFRMNSEAMTGAGIFAGDVLIVDRSIKAATGKIIVAVLNGELFVRRFQQHFNKATLSADNKKFADIELGEFSQFVCWGVVTCVIHRIEQALITFGKSKTDLNRK